MTQSEKQRQQRLYQIQKQRYLGVGDENTTDVEWKTDVRRDTYNSLQGHAATLEYLTLANDDIMTKHEMRMYLLRKMAGQSETKKGTHQPDKDVKSS